MPLADATGPRTVVARIARAARPGNPLLEVETGAAVHELLVALRRARADLAPDGEQVLQALWPATPAGRCPSPTTPPGTA